MIRILAKLIRKKLGNLKLICDKCLSQYKWQTPTGEMLCEECNKEYCYAKNKTRLG